MKSRTKNVLAPRERVGSTFFGIRRLDSNLRRARQSNHGQVIEGRPRRMLWLLPIGDEQVSVLATAMPLGRKSEGYVGPAKTYVRLRPSKHVTAAISAAVTGERCRTKSRST
jgi:hypothetical protein